LEVALLAIDFEALGLCVFETLPLDAIVFIGFATDFLAGCCRDCFDAELFTGFDPGFCFATRAGFAFATGFLETGLVDLLLVPVALVGAALERGRPFIFLPTEPTLLPKSRPFFEDLEDAFALLEAIDYSLSYFKSLRTLLKDTQHSNSEWYIPKELHIFAGSK
jgi:hypothetical protein